MLSLEEKEEIWNKLDEVVESVLRTERLVIGDDFCGLLVLRREMQKDRWWWIL